MLEQRLHEQPEPVGAAVASLAAGLSALVSADYEAITVLNSLQSGLNPVSEEKKVWASNMIPIIRMIQHKLAVKCSTLTKPTAIKLLTGAILVISPHPLPSHGLTHSHLNSLSADYLLVYISSFPLFCLPAEHMMSFI